MKVLVNLALCRCEGSQVSRGGPASRRTPLTALFALSLLGKASLGQINSCFGFSDSSPYAHESPLSEARGQITLVTLNMQPQAQ